MTLSCGIGLSSTKRFLYFVLLFNIPVCVYGQQQLKTAHFPARYMNEAASSDGKLVFYYFYSNANSLGTRVEMSVRIFPRGVNSLLLRACVPSVCLSICMFFFGFYGRQMIRCVQRACGQAINTNSLATLMAF